MNFYQNVTTVSELFNADGTQILSDLLQCRREPWFDCKTFIALQSRPSEYQIRTKWQRLCRQLHLEIGTEQAPTIFGRWQIPGHRLRRRRQTYFEHATRRVYHWQHGCYWEYTRGDCLIHAYRPKQPSGWLPTPTCIPIDGDVRHSGLLIARHLPAPQEAASATFQKNQEFHEYLSSLPLWERQLLQGIVVYTNPDEIRKKFPTPITSTSRLILVSDGSSRQSHITYGWALGSDDNEIFAEHAGAGYGEPTSHRAERWGMLSGVLFLHRLYTFLQIHELPSLSSVPLSILSDNNGLVQRISHRLKYKKCYPNATLTPDWDLVEQIVDTFSALPATTHKSVDWVRGHQDQTDSELSVEAVYNIRADELAGQFPLDRNHNGTCPLLPVEKCRLVLNNKIIQAHYSQVLRETYTLQAYFVYLEKRHGWTSTQRQQVDWTSFQRAATNTLQSPVQILKFVHDKLPTNSEKAKANPHQSATCTYCEQRETFHHLLTCQNIMSTEFREDF